MKTAVRLVSALVVSLLYRGASSQSTTPPTKICNLQPSETDDDFFDISSVIVSSQSQLQAVLGDCTEINGNVVIANNYDGLFTLEVRIFNGSIFQPLGFGYPKLTSILLPSANYIDSIELQRVDALETIYIPAVTQIGSLTLSSNSSTSVVAESLYQADIIDIEVANLQVTFPALARVDTTLYLSANFPPPSIVDFPSLVNVSSMSVIGNLSSLSLPELAVASIEQTADLYENYGLQIGNLATPLTPLSVNLPSLYNASGLNIFGFFQNISMPLLSKITGMLSITANSTADLSLDTLESVMAMTIQGRISSFSMPAIKDIQTWVEIASSLPMDCSIPQNQWAQTNSSFVAGVPTDSDVHSFACQSLVQKKTGLSTGAKVGIAFAAIFFLAVLLAFTLLSTKQCKGTRIAKPAIPVSEHELEQRWPTTPMDRERLPPYTESIASDIGPIAEPKSAV